MPYVKLDDMYWANEKVRDAGFDGAGLYSMCLSMSGHFLTDGFISDSRLKLVGAPKRVIDKVTEAGLWKRKGDGFQIPDYTQTNYSKAEVLVHRKKEAERKRIARMAKAGLSDPESGEESTPDGDPESLPESTPESPPASGNPKPYQSLPQSFNPDVDLGSRGKPPDFKPPTLRSVDGGAA